MKTPYGRLLRDGQVLADVAAIEWTRFDGKPVPWTGWLTLPDGAAPIAAGPCVLVIEGRLSGSINGWSPGRQPVLAFCSWRGIITAVS
jgi:hypothetical protein